MILHGHVLDKLKELPDESVQCVVTSPPYWGLRDYGTATWKGGDDDCDHKIPKNESDPKQAFDGSAGSHAIRFNRTHCNKCGAKRIDQQIGLEKSPEEYVENMVKVFREVKRVLKKDGTCWLNLGDSYMSSGGASRHHGYTDPKYTNGRKIEHFEPQAYPHDTIKPKDLVGIPWRVALALQADGWWLRQDIIWHKPNPMPESVTDRCTKAHEYIFLLTKSAKYYYDNEVIREPANYAGQDRGKSRNISPSGMSEMDNKQYEKRNKRSVWTINTKPFKDAHFAVFPTKIPELCIKAGSKEGNTVLDPFFGSGTTGWVAQRLSRKWIGIELNEQYIKIAKKRFQQGELFYEGD